MRWIKSWFKQCRKNKVQKTQEEHADWLGADGFMNPPAGS